MNVDLFALVRVDIFLEASTMSQHLALPRRDLAWLLHALTHPKRSNQEKTVVVQAVIFHFAVTRAPTWCNQ